MQSLPIRNPFPGAASFLETEVVSTMIEARRLARLGLPSGSLIAAEFQSDGRGRLGERWESEPGLNLLFTLRLEAGAVRLPALPLRVGAVAARAIVLYAIRQNQRLGTRPLVKWPNDLLFGDRKTAGILCESRAGEGEAGVYVGVGINCNQTGFPAFLADRASSLALELGRPIDRWVLLELFLDLLYRELAEKEWKKGVEERLWRRGETIRFRPGAPGSGEPVQGVLEGIDDSGSLLLRLPQQEVALSYASGEILLEAEAS